MLLTTEIDSVARQAQRASADAALAARIEIADDAGMKELREVADMFASIWGLSRDAGPMPAELMRGISHAGCCVSVAYDAAGAVCGAAAAIVSPGSSSMYSLLAGVRPGLTDSGVGFALKQHQRAWALTRGIPTMTWTFDPLVSRNARFNLSKLGAHVNEYEKDFYGQMGGGINSNDESDRLIAMWVLASKRAIECSNGNPEPVELPAFAGSGTLALGPDSEPALIEAEGALWCRVPPDIVSLRAQGPETPARWRECIREILTGAFSSGYTACGVTRSGWYRLLPERPL